MSFLLKPLIGIAINGFVLYLLARFVDGITYTGGIKFFILGGVVLGIINVFVKPLVKVIALPLVFITGGLFSIVLSGLTLWFLQYFIGVAAFQDVTLAFENFETYAIGAIVFGVINWLFNLID